MTKYWLGLSVAAAALFLFGCNKPGDFLYVHPNPIHIDSSVKIKQFSSNKLDILWVIDNSNSMLAHQQDVINNMGTFITSLTGNTTLDWKSGLISTDISDPPYAGFDPGTELLSSDPQVATKFKAAIGRLGIEGSGYEMMFSPMEKVLNNYPSFLRPDAALAIIIISDAAEQSGIDPNAFVQFITQKKGDLSQTFFYGFFNPNEWCQATDTPWNWAGSPFETVSNLIQGHAYKLCDPNFAANLSNLGSNLGQEVSASRIYLKNIPQISTIQVLYLGKPVPSGPRSACGYWTYRQDINAIEFSDLSFAPGANESVQVVYDVDQGVE